MRPSTFMNDSGNALSVHTELPCKVVDSRAFKMFLSNIKNVFLRKFRHRVGFPSVRSTDRLTANMLPISSSPDCGNATYGRSKTKGNSLIGFSVMASLSNLKNLFFGKNGCAVVLSLPYSTVPDAIKKVCLFGIPSEIFKRIVGRIVVIMTRLKPFGTWTYKCLKDKAMDLTGMLNPFIADEDPQFSLRACNGVDNARYFPAPAFSPRPNTTKIARFIFGKTWNGLPYLFHAYHLFYQYTPTIHCNQGVII